MALEHYLSLWNLKSPQKLTTTETSELFLVDSPHGPSVLKILNETGKKHEAVGAEFLKACQGNGAALLYEYDEGAHLIERLYGDNLYQFSKQNKEREASKVFVEIIKKVHQIKIQEIRLKSFTTLFEGFDRVSVPSELAEIVSQAKTLAGDLIQSQADQVLLHGDLHHENVLQNSKGEFVCFDAQACLGDPAYELGTTLKNPWDYPGVSHDSQQFQERARFFSRELKLPYERVVGFAFVHSCLSVCWALEDKTQHEHSLSVAQMIRPLL